MKRAIPCPNARPRHRKPRPSKRTAVNLIRGTTELPVGKKPENGQTEVRVMYRFGPPPVASDAGYSSEDGVFGDDLKNGSLS